jgi:hypothetical protein
LTQDWEIEGHVMSTSWWVLINLPTPYLPSDLEILLTEYGLYALPNLLSSQAAALSPTTCRLAVGGLSVVQKAPPASGAFSVSEPTNTASGIIWRTGDPGRRGWSITYLPGCPHDFVEGGWQLSAEGWGNILASAIGFRSQLESLPSYPPQTLVLGTLLRQSGGAPRAAAVFRPFVDVAPAPKVVTIRRRVPLGRSVLPF